MRLKLTLQRPDAQRTDIVVTSDTTATVQDVARRIVESDPARDFAASPGDVLTLAVAVADLDRVQQARSRPADQRRARGLGVRGRRS